jgi:hypothetical protein
MVPSMKRETSRSSRVVAVGDLNGAAGVLRTILLAMEVVDGRHRWCAQPGTHLIQIGDVFNRGATGREAFLWLEELARQAPRRGGRVTRLLGNHEVYMALKVHAFSNEEEQLSFATASERREWPERVREEEKRMLGEMEDEVILPLEPRSQLWRMRHAPGRQAMLRAFSPRGRIGRQIRRLPVAVAAEGCVFVHAPLTPRWAELGVTGLARTARQSWAADPTHYRALTPGGILNALDGPLWNRQLVLRDPAPSAAAVARSLHLLGATRMVVGHVQTREIPGEGPGRIAVLHDGHLICIDVSLSERRPEQWAALEVRDGTGVEHGSAGRRVLWRRRP